MKKPLVFIALLSFVCVSACVSLITGNGDIVTSERALSPFNNVKISQIAQVRYHSSKEYKAVISCDSNIEKYVEVQSSSHTLKIGLDNASVTYWNITFIVDIYSPEITGISLSGSSRLELVDTLSVLSLKIKLSGDSKMEGELRCEGSFNADISGGSSLKTQGKSGAADIRLSGSSRLELVDTLSVPSLKIKLSGGSKMEGELLCEGSFNADISGGSSLKTQGKSGAADIRLSGSSRLELVDTLSVPSLKIKLSGGSKMEGKLLCEGSFDTDISGGSVLKIKS
ncbi:MAG: DUF2807 domain-containing protein [Spirochaetaceae bacterium]|jgi:hypothetical protein|nr:DUF2807 domain-containing protein [Spirochaetaceae bacterium]